MMWPTRKNRFRSGLDTTSTADISFVLLIFFLVTTSMDIDKGLVRELSPMEPEEEQVEEQEVDANGMMELRIQADGRLLVDGEEQTVQAAGKKMEAFLERRGSNHVIVLGAHPQAAYDSYFQVQQQLVAVYRQWRNRKALHDYGCAYEECTPAQKQAVRKACPQRVKENYEFDKDGKTE